MGTAKKSDDRLAPGTTSTSKSQPLVGVVLLALSVLLAIGLNTFATPCVGHGDAVLASCHWAGRVVMAIDIVLGVLSLVRVFEMDEGERRGLSLACACLGVLIACVPGVVVDLCPDPGAQCNVVMRPFVMAVGIVVASVGGVDLTRRLLLLRPSARK